MKSFSYKRRALAGVALIVVVLFFVRPGVSGLKVRIANAISRAVARPVEIGSVHLRFLPRPGFDLENLIIHEDPAFGVEPMLRAPEVTALVRLTSLVRGRLDISRLELTEPSLNLVRRANGRWNWEALLERTAHSPLAPTAKSTRESRAGFPYIEASSGRINFKAGEEKKAYALLDADFALWQDSENSWGVRMHAEPLRTDMGLSDTGSLRMNGTWMRAASLRETPLQFSISWQHAQLGQLSKLASGSDKGWRGDARLEAVLTGTPAAMRISTDASIQDFHRYDITASDGLVLAAHCDGKYSSVEKAVHEIFCSAPVGGGMVTLHGDAARPGEHKLDLALNIEDVPVNALVQLARRAKKDLPADFSATGRVQGNFAVRDDNEASGGAQFQGRGEVSNLKCQSASTKAELASVSVPFMLSSTIDGAQSILSNKSFHASLAQALPAAGELHLEFGPFPVGLGRPAPAQARGWVGRSGYAVVVHGEGEVAHTLRMAGLLGLQAAKLNAEGAGQMDLQIAGSWAAGNAVASALPKITGTVQLHNVRATVRGLNGPVEITSATIKLTPDEALIENLNARAGETRWMGFVSLPRGCGVAGACLVHFGLNTDRASLSALSGWLGAHPSQRRWYQVLSREQTGEAVFLQKLRASGKINVGHLMIRNLVADRVSASLDLEHGTMKISDLRADFLGGKHLGEWQADFSAAAPVYTGSGTLTGISLEQMARTMQDTWISGTGEGSYQFKSSGTNADTFWESAEGELRFDLRDGALPHISLAGNTNPLQIVRWQGRAQLHDGKIEIEKGSLVSSGRTYEISGTASLGQELDFKLSSDTQGKIPGAGPLVYSITGTLPEPHVVLTPAPETQAQLKP